MKGKEKEETQSKVYKKKGKKRKAKENKAQQEERKETKEKGKYSENEACGGKKKRKKQFRL